MPRISPIIICIILFVTSASGQTLNYEVVRGSKKLGDMKVARNAYNNEVNYRIESKVSFRILFRFTIDFESSSKYVDGVLERESTIRQLNGSTQKASAIIKQGDDYSHTLSDVTSIEKGPITYSVASIYFVEPTPDQKVFSPQFGKYLTFEKVDEHVYELESPDGLNTYTYMNGICTEVKVARDFATFYFKMTPETLLAVKNREETIVGENK
ncbi:MAG: DUF6134 family protein [Bacteroidota bacterium]